MFRIAILQETLTRDSDAHNDPGISLDSSWIEVVETFFLPGKISRVTRPAIERLEASKLLAINILLRRTRASLSKYRLEIEIGIILRNFISWNWNNCVLESTFDPWDRDSFIFDCEKKNIEFIESGNCTSWGRASCGSLSWDLNSQIAVHKNGEQLPELQREHYMTRRKKWLG